MYEKRDKREKRSKRDKHKKHDKREKLEKRGKDGMAMRQLGEGVLILIVFMLATLAVLQVDRQCKAMTGYGGDITASAEIIVEKVGPLK